MTSMIQVAQRWPTRVVPFLVTMSVVTGCEPAYDEPTIRRAAPALVELNPEEIVTREIRGCAFEGSHALGSDSVELAVILVAATARSDSSGTLVLTLPPSEGGEGSAVSEPMNTAESEVSAQQSGFLEARHGLKRMDVSGVGPFSDLDERCSEWKTVEFAWTSVTGGQPLSVRWEVLFALQQEQSIEVGIDFRTYE